MFGPRYYLISCYSWWMVQKLFFTIHPWKFLWQSDLSNTQEWFWCYSACRFWSLFYMRSYEIFYCANVWSMYQKKSATLLQCLIYLRGFSFDCNLPWQSQAKLGPMYPEKVLIFYHSSEMSNVITSNASKILKTHLSFILKKIWHFFQRKNSIKIAQ